MFPPSSLTLSLTLAFTLTAPAAANLLPMPLSPRGYFRTEGFFQGGDYVPGVLSAVRRSLKGSAERWEVLLQTPRLPRFQLRYEKAETFEGEDGSTVTRRPARFLLFLESIRRSSLTKSGVEAERLQSRHVKEIIVYPAIEDGHMAIEWILKHDVAFEPHATLNPAKLVLDLK